MRLLPLPGVFRPRSDSRTLAARLRAEPLAGRSVLDLCTGSGILAVTAALGGARHVVAVDVSRRAIASTRAAAWLNGVGGRVDPRRGDLFDAVRDERFDLIVSNPPYLPSRDGAIPPRGAARAWEGGASGRVFIDRICAQARSHLTPGGALLLLHSSVCDEAASLRALGRVGLAGEVVERATGPLGPLLRGRAEILRDRGMPDDREDVIIVRATTAPVPAG